MDDIIQYFKGRKKALRRREVRRLPSPTIRSHPTIVCDKFDAFLHAQKARSSAMNGKATCESSYTVALRIKAIENFIVDYDEHSSSEAPPSEEDK